MMDENSLLMQIIIMLFLGVFQTVGAIFVGVGVRQMLNGESSGAGQVLFGGIFAGTGTLFSFLFMHELNAWSFPVSVMVMFFVMLGTMFAPESFLQRFGASISVIAVGSFAAFVGGAVLIGTLSAGKEILFGILFGGCWGSIGLIFVLTGISALWRGKTLRWKQKRPGKYELEEEEEQGNH